MFVNDLFHHRKPETRTLGFRGHIGLERTTQDTWRETGTIVRYGQLDGLPVFAGRIFVLYSLGVQSDMGRRPTGRHVVCRRILRILQQVVNDLPQLGRIALDFR